MWEHYLQTVCFERKKGQIMVEGLGIVSNKDKGICCSFIIEQHAQLSEEIAVWDVHAKLCHTVMPGCTFM